MVSHNVV